MAKTKLEYDVSFEVQRKREKYSEHRAFQNALSAKVIITWAYYLFTSNIILFSFRDTIME